MPCSPSLLCTQLALLSLLSLMPGSSCHVSLYIQIYTITDILGEQSRLNYLKRSIPTSIKFLKKTRNAKSFRIPTQRWAWTCIMLHCPMPNDLDNSHCPWRSPNLHQHNQMAFNQGTFKTRFRNRFIWHKWARDDMGKFYQKCIVMSSINLSGPERVTEG